MSSHKNQAESRTAEAMAEVLAAEADVRRRVGACRDELHQQISAEQERARAINRRTNERLSRIHQACDATIQRRSAELREHAERQAIPVDPDTADRQRLDRAIERLAAILTSPADG